MPSCCSAIGIEFACGRGSDAQVYLDANDRETQGFTWGCRPVRRGQG
jgi:hypothetical protein